jgi:hypothetical protein
MTTPQKTPAEGDQPQEGTDTMATNAAENEARKEIVNAALYVTEESKRAMAGWPIEIRAIFDPKADRELAEKIAREKKAGSSEPSDADPPF